MTLAKLPQNAKVAVLGAGILGLTFTYFLSKYRPDIQFTIFEKQGRPGGWMSSPSLVAKDTQESIVLEKGPRTLRGVKDGTLLMIDILRQLGLQSQVEVLSKTCIANKKYILDSSREIVQVPDSIGSAVNFAKNVLFMDAKMMLGVLKEPFVKPLKDDETIEQFFRRRFGSTALTDNVMSAVIHGIYAGDVGKLSVKSVLPFLKDIEDQSGSVIKHMLKSLTKSKNKAPEEISPELQEYEKLISPSAGLLELQNKLKNYPMIKLQSGMEIFPKSLATYLETNTNTKILYNSSIDSVDAITGKVNGEQFDHIRSTINSHALAKALPSTDPLVPELKSIQYASIFLTNVYTKTPSLIPKGKPGFGFLCPRYRNITQNEDALLGTIYDSDVENNVEGLFSSVKATPQEANKITIMMGGHYYSHWSIPSDGINLKIVKNVLESKLNVDLSKFNIKVIKDGERLEVDTIKDNDLIISYNLHLHCIPQYNLGYYETKAKVDEILKHDYKLSFGGAVFGDGIGVPDCVILSFKDTLKLK
ncbi:Protoporphyrinogen oxidase [Candida viswanathii]|uniref:Protoporphyrinogen oxidase n=1 Tax=Candida viswanathii TaxID=5486 RepID=A0A367Y4M9_9ASCO|nr:Protoporphyrinogen oxidase [Candida viswanathii]